MTGNSTLDALADALGMGATDYLLKPLDQTELIEIVGQAHERRRRWQQALAGTLAARRNRAPVSAR
jgi:DNA-binding NtrC family response regulator